MRPGVKRWGGCVGILLAAGRSRRFGGDKLLEQLPGGTLLVLASAYALRAALPRVVVVVRPDSLALSALLAVHGFETVIAKHADSGMGASLAAGVAATRKASGWLIALADMPFIHPDTIAAVANEIGRGVGMAAPRYKGRRGHPVGFSDAYRDQLLRLVGDEGARSLLRQHASELALIDCNDPGVLADIDHAEDLALVCA